MRMAHGLVGAVAGAMLAVVSGTSGAGTLVGKIDLPSQLPNRPSPVEPGFVERFENPVTPVRPIAVLARMVVVVEGDEKPAAPPRVQWNLVGESFNHPVIAAPAGAEVTIVNNSKTARTLTAKEDPKLIEAGPINPTGPKTFRPTESGKVYTIIDKDAPHLIGRVVVVNTQYIAYPDESGHFEIDNIPPGSYKLKVWYDEGWIKRTDDSVEVTAKSKTEINPKIASDAFASPKK
ncbi:hypothetical protein BH11MYX1_BH11MYX1_15780 [soil metagenome]